MNRRSGGGDPRAGHCCWEPRPTGSPAPQHLTPTRFRDESLNEGCTWFPGLSALGPHLLSDGWGGGGQDASRSRLTDPPRPREDRVSFQRLHPRMVAGMVAGMGPARGCDSVPIHLQASQPGWGWGRDARWGEEEGRTPCGEPRPHAAFAAGTDGVLGGTVGGRLSAPDLCPSPMRPPRGRGAHPCSVRPDALISSRWAQRATPPRV